MGKVVVLGVFVADTAYRAARMPNMGESPMTEPGMPLGKHGLTEGFLVRNLPPPPPAGLTIS